LRRRYFDLRNKDMALQTSSLLIPLHQAPIAARVLENQNPSNFRGMLLPPKNPNFASVRIPSCAGRWFALVVPGAPTYWLGD
jgi:hypothetical protein